MMACVLNKVYYLFGGSKYQNKKSNSGIELLSGDLRWWIQFSSKNSGLSVSMWMCCDGKLKDWTN